ncbi:DUF2252 family protein [Cupriavidus sp. amp6]|uniref:DUF2252 family protein n=1 Tax=Cupriavidus sp. amp6 TaxID=388051 RepID=UPI00040CFD0C|nr:DUF2252 family protein [Cupriavidus sp. amp6]
MKTEQKGDEIARRAVRPRQRPKALMEIRNLKMAQSPHRYVRGNAAKFYEWLDEIGPNALPQGPPIWICGDCHIGNLGAVGNTKGDVAIQIRDMDQTTIGNPAHDLIRLSVSLATAARGSHLSGVVIARMTEALLAGYLGVLDSRHRFKGRPIKPAAIRACIKEATNRTWRQLARKRLKTDQIPPGKQFWPLRRDERTAIERLCRDQAMIESVTHISAQEGDDKLQVIDAAYWVKGCSSLGRLRYAVLLGDGNRWKYSLLDIKEAALPAAPCVSRENLPRDNGDRVVQGAKNLSPFLGNRMVAARILGKSVVVRELLPQDLKLEVETLPASDATELAYYLGSVVGRGHAGQLSQSEARTWRRELMRHHGKTIEAPSWLWTCIVDLIGIHERQYLDHCRRWALGGFAPESR